VHAESGQAPPAPKEIIPGAVANASGVRVDWDAVTLALKENTGLPHLIGVRRQADSASRLDQVF
jgi:L,D-transpeptidase ErfK/SrfK